MNAPQVNQKSVTDDIGKSRRQVFRTRAGRFKPIKGKSILICIGDQPSQWIQDFLPAFAETNPRENVFFLELDHGGPAKVKSGARLPYPYRFPGLNERFLRKLRAGLILVDSAAAPPAHFLASAMEDHIAVAQVESTSTAHHATVEKPSVDMDSDIQRLNTMEVMDAARLLSRYMAMEREPYVKFKKRLRFFLWKHVMYRFHNTSLARLSTLKQINHRLGEPDSILCLGNGPSSEESRLSDGQYDAVFRVNHRWVERGFFSRADVIFTGAVESVLKVGTNSIYVFINPDRAMRMVMRARQQVPKLGFSNALELGFPLEEFTPYQPTNGLIMVYLAVKLNPKVLTIAGIDLFRDPRGAYPDESDTPNHYTSAHNADKEINLLLELLTAYPGELRIIGDKLASEYERYTRENC